MRSKTIAFGAIALLCGSPALAVEDSGNTASKSAKAKDPNRMVCEKQEVLGSRLASRKVCMTAAEWADQRGQDRQAIDRGQMRTCVTNANC